MGGCGSPEEEHTAHSGVEGIVKGMFRGSFLGERASDFQGQVGVSWANKTGVQGERMVEATGKARAKQRRVYQR